VTTIRYTDTATLVLVSQTKLHSLGVTHVLDLVQEGVVFTAGHDLASTFLIPSRGIFTDGMVALALQSGRCRSHRASARSTCPTHAAAK
jgi:hypothetical protein